MRLKRTATLAVVGAALAAWLAAAATSGRRDAPNEGPRVLTADVAGMTLAAEVARLHDRLAPVAIPRQPGRDLFRFASAKPRPVAAAPRPAVTEASTAIQTPPRPPIALAGIAEDARPDGTVRTAIISTPGQLFLVREGEAVTARFRVSRIASDVVELLDLVDNSTLRLPLK